MDAMYQRGDTQHMLLAMNELRHQQIEIRGIAEMLWDYPGFEPREYLAALLPRGVRRSRRAEGRRALRRVLREVPAHHEERRLQDDPHLLQGHGADVHRHRQPPEHRHRHARRLRAQLPVQARHLRARASGTWAKCSSRPSPCGPRSRRTGATSSTTSSSTPSGWCAGSTSSRSPRRTPSRG